MIYPETLPDEVMERIEAKIDRASGDCWIWTAGKRNKQGYGGFNYQDRCYQAHRLIYVLLRGPVPSELFLDHLCRNPACVNPDHLEPVTNRENLVRGVGPVAQNAAKTHCIRGHAFSGDNLRVTTRGGRVCLTCKRDRDALRYV